MSSVNHQQTTISTYNNNNNNTNKKNKKKKKKDIKYKNCNDHAENKIITLESTFKFEKDNIDLTLSLFSLLFLQPEYILVIVSQLMKTYPGEYFSCSTIPSEWFKDLVKSILFEPLKFEITGFKGVASHQSINHKIVLTLRLFGTGLHSILLESLLDYSKKQKEPAMIHKILTEFIEYRRNCFRMIITQSLDGEIRMTHFCYNHILEYLFRPELFIIASFRIFMIAAFKQATQDNKTENLRSYLSGTLSFLEPLLSPENQENTKINVQGENNEQWNRTRYALLSLKRIVCDNTNDIREIFQSVQYLWSEQASQAFEFRQSLIRIQQQEEEEEQ